MALQGSMEIFLTFRGPRSKKMLRTPYVDFTNMFTYSFYVYRSQKRKKTVKTSLCFCPFEIYVWKSNL